MPGGTQGWKPTEILRFVEPYPTGAETIRVVTDAGDAFLKALGNRGGPHLLACEYVGTQLAAWLGLKTLDFALIEVREYNELPFASGGLALPGPAFVTRAEDGVQWSGSGDELRKLVNPEDIPKLVLFDTWLLNCDRYPPRALGRRPNLGNVFLSREGAERGMLVLKAIDHTHCFTCGREIAARLATIDRIRSTDIYGLFPQFREPDRSYMAADALQEAAEHLRKIDTGIVRNTVESIPVEWEVGSEARRALTRLIVERAAYMAETVVGRLAPRQLGLWDENGREART